MLCVQKKVEEEGGHHEGSLATGVRYSKKSTVSEANVQTKLASRSQTRSYLTLSPFRNAGQNLFAARTPKEEKARAVRPLVRPASTACTPALLASLSSIALAPLPLPPDLGVVEWRFEDTVMGHRSVCERPHQPEKSVCGFV